MESAPPDYAFPENLKLWLWRRQSVVELRHFLLKHPLSLVAFFGERVKGVREPVIKPRQNPNRLGGDRPYECISWRRWHLLLKSSTRS